MTFSPTHLAAIDLLVEARLSTVPASAPDRPKWEGLRAQVLAELAAAKPGERVFAIDLPLLVTLPPPPPRPAKVRKRPLSGKALVKALARQAARAKKGPSKPVVVTLVPTLNAYNGMKPWMKTRAREHLDKLLAEEIARWPAAHWGGTIATVGRGKNERRTPTGGKRRLVRVTRFSSRRPDDLSVDVLGGKIPIDRLVLAQVLGGDSDVWCAREARWEPAKTGEGHVRVEVFELEGEAGIPRTAKAKKRAQGDASAGH